MIYNYLLLFVLIINLFIAGIVFKSSRGRLYSKLFGCFIIFTDVWLLSNYLIDRFTNYSLVLLVTRITFSAVSVMVLFLFLYSVYFPKNTPKIKRIYVYLFIVIGLSVSILCFSDLVVSGIKFNPIANEMIFGSFYPLYFSQIVLYLVVALGSLYWEYRRVQNILKLQLEYLFTGILLSVVFISVTNIIMPLVFNNFDLSFIGSFSIVFIIVFTAYAIVRHRLMDIRLIVVKSIVYAFLFLIIGVIYTFFIFIIGSFIFKDFTGVEAYWAAMAVAIIVTFTFQPIKNILTKWTDKVFFKGQYNFEELTSKLNDVATSTIILPELLFKFLNSLLEEMRITRGAFILLEEDKIYETESVGYKQALELNESEIKHLTIEKKTEVFDEVEEGSKCKEIMRKYDASLILPLMTEGNVIGLLFLGEKKSGDIYSQKDIQVLEIITSQLSLGVQNAKAYEKTQKFNLILRAEINRATKELRDVNQRLINADKAKDEFISVASHEIRTPIAALEGYLSMLNNQKLKAQEVSEVSKRSYESVERLSALVKDLLDVSRLEQKRIKINKQPTRLERLIEQTIEGFQLQAQDRGIYLKFQKAERLLPEVNVDPERISEVLNNLIGNAMKFTEEGGITISLNQKDNKALLSVADTGIGIPKESFPHLFKKFYQAEAASSALSNQRGGTGLGLYIVKNIIELHEGNVEIESAKGKGTTFKITLPIK